MEMRSPSKQGEPTRACLLAPGEATRVVFVSNEATVAEQEYLERIYWLEEAELPMTGANLAGAMHPSAPTPHEMIKRPRKGGYISRNRDKTIVFTENGREHASAIVKRHRLV